MKTLDLVPRPIRTHLIGKAAVALLSFHLARRGIDFAVTTDSSSVGDIWADFGSGVVAIEVKGSAKNAWYVRADQSARIDHWAFVGIADTRCWLVAGEQVRESIGGVGASKDKIITLRDVEAMDGIPLHAGLPVLLTPRKAGLAVRPGGIRKVRRRLATGEVKEYTYGINAGALES
jgi:hypothetical protein